MKKSIILLVLLFAFVGKAEAAVINTSVSCSLLDAIISAETNSAVSGCISGSGADTVNLTQDETITSEYNSSGNAFPVITEPLIIEGGNHTIFHENLEAGSVRLFEISGTSFILKNTNLERVASSGPNQDNGGAIKAFKSRLVLEESNFFGFNATSNGGAIFADNSNLSIKDTDFILNWANEGGAIYVDNGILKINGARFDSNNAWVEGGAIMTNNVVDTSIDLSTFYQNASPISGAISAGKNSNSKSLAIVDSDFDQNLSIMGMDGAAVLWHGQNGNVHIRNTTFSGNGGTGNGSALYNDGNLANISVINSTFSGNETNGAGGAIINYGENTTLVLGYNTFINNSSTTGGALAVENFALANSFIENNIFLNNNGGDCEFISTSGTSFLNNLSDGSPCGSTSATGVFATLQNNGGPTKTHKLTAGSNAIDTAITNTLAVHIKCPKTDQRHIARPFDGNNDGVAKCDIGAYELNKKIITTAPGLRK